MSDRFEQLRLIEALLFASAEPMGAEKIARHLPEGADLDGLLRELATLYANRGVNLVKLGERWAFRTAADVAPLLQIETSATRRLSRAAVETLAILAYHQPVTRGEVEEIRGVALSRGTLDTLLEAGWIKPKGRRRTPGRPVTWGTTDDFMDHFGLESLDALPGLAELKAAGLLDARPAITALTARGRLLDAADEGVDMAEETEPEQDEEETPLASDFGEDLVPDEHEDEEDEAASASSGEGEDLDDGGDGDRTAAVAAPKEHP
jgi:segregation and condensation protein B